MLTEQTKTVGANSLLSGKYNLVMNLTPQGEIYDVYDGIYHISCICFYSDRLECFMNYKSFTDSIYKHIFKEDEVINKIDEIRKCLIGLSLRVHSNFKGYYVLIDDERICKCCGEVVNIESSFCGNCRKTQRGI